MPHPGFLWESKMNAQEARLMAQGQWGGILAYLAPLLQPALDREGRHVPCPVHGGTDGFRVFKDVDDSGGTVCNTCGFHADGFSTLMWVNGWDFSTTLRAVSEYVDAGISTPVPTKTVKKTKVEKNDVEENNRLRNSLNRVWNETISINDKDAEPVRLYLARRGISIKAPESLRFHPSLPYYDGDKKIGEFAAMIAMISGENGEPVTIHRTYLTAEGKKAAVESPKKMMAYPANRKLTGGAIRLGEVDRVMAVAEGLETSMAVLEGMKLPTWCAVNAHMLANMMPPKGVQQILVFADKDKSTDLHPKGHGQAAATQLVQRLWAMGIKASAFVPAGEIQQGEKSLDWLDILNRNGEAGFPTLQSIERVLRRVA